MHEKALIKRCQRGDRQAFDALIRLYYDYVFGFLLKTTADAALSEDLTQETFLKMVRNIEKFDPNGGAGLGTWLITIAKNGYIDHLRRNRIHLENIDALPLASGGIADAVAQKLQYEQLIKALEALPTEQALAIRLKYVENMTLAQIAERFGVPPKTIKSRIHDGTAKLRKKFSIGKGADDA
ncbi:MAG: sigma-70 family RNA polymerase sigma factor [Clostridia bacterium]|nr:sigma-70 family RNA polymerase sigma factor [Clostridia bacterium]